MTALAAARLADLEQRNNDLLAELGPARTRLLLADTAAERAALMVRIERLEAERALVGAEVRDLLERELWS